jgi:carbon monoxide dehydrogenase subunit G
VHFSGSAEFAADRSRVWGYLIDPTRLGPCSPIPVQRVDDRHFRATTKVGSGFFAATVVANLEITDVVDGQGAKIAGSGGAMGTTVQANSTFALRDGELAGETIVDWTLDLDARGGFAPAITKVIQDRGQEAVDQLLACLRREVEGKGR